MIIFVVRELKRLNEKKSFKEGLEEIDMRLDAEESRTKDLPGKQNLKPLDMQGNWEERGTLSQMGKRINNDSKSCLLVDRICAIYTIEQQALPKCHIRSGGRPSCP